MKRGDLYRVHRASPVDQRRFRVYVILSRQPVIDSNYSTVICAPVYSRFAGLSTQVEVGVNEGLKHDSAIFCDELVSIPKAKLHQYVGAVSEETMVRLGDALRIALDLSG